MQPSFERVLKPPQASFHLFTRRDREFEFRWHHHPEYELTLILESRGRRFVGDHVGDYADGDFVLLGPYVPHTWHSRPEARRRHRAIGVQFEETFLGDALHGCPELGPIRGLLERSARGIRFTGATAGRVAARFAALERRRGLSRLTALLDVLDDLAHARSIELLSSRVQPAPASGHDRRRVDAVCRFIHERFREPLPQTAAARAAHLSPAAFSRFFRRALGTTFVEYVNDLRVGHACRLLIGTDDPITEVCFDSGFNNVSNFNRAFRARKRMSPSEFRRAFAVTAF